MTHERPAELSPQETKALLDKRQILLVDVREPAEFAIERIRGAVLVPLSTFDAKSLPHDESYRIVFQCGSGKRSLLAAEKHLAAGGHHATHMAGGIAAWKVAGLPLIRVDPSTGLVVDHGHR